MQLDNDHIVVAGRPDQEVAHSPYKYTFKFNAIPRPSLNQTGASSNWVLHHDTQGLARPRFGVRLAQTEAGAPQMGDEIVLDISRGAGFARYDQ